MASSCRPGSIVPCARPTGTCSIGSCIPRFGSTWKGGACVSMQTSWRRKGKIGARSLEPFRESGRSGLQARRRGGLPAGRRYEKNRAARRCRAAGSPSRRCRRRRPYARPPVLRRRRFARLTASSSTDSPSPAAPASRRAAAIRKPAPMSTRRSSTRSASTTTRRARSTR